MPHGVLFRSGAEAKIRQHLIETDLLETVIGLGKNLFYGTTIETCLVILRMDKGANWAGIVQIIDGSKRFQPGRNQNSLSDEDVNALYEAYYDIEADPNIRQALVEHAEIEETAGTNIAATSNKTLPKPST